MPNAAEGSPGATAIRPFTVEIPQAEIEALRARIGAARLPSRELVDDRSQGVQLATIQELARYWATDYDWRACEARLNALPMFRTEIDGADIHFIHVKSRHENALPLIMTHGPTRRDLPRPAQLGREGLPQPHLLPRGGQGRPLRRLGRARAVRDRGPGGVQAAALARVDGGAGQRARSMPIPVRGIKGLLGFIPPEPGRSCERGSS